MSALLLDLEDKDSRLGLKGPRAAEWLGARGIVLPTAPNSWTRSSAAEGAGALLVARLGQFEFFLEQEAPAKALEVLAPETAAAAPGVYPVLREDSAFRLSGTGVHEVLAQVCNVHFAGLALDSHPVIMTLMIGVAVLMVPEGTQAEPRYRFWCDPTFAPSLSENLREVVVDCGGTIRGVSE